MVNWEQVQSVSLGIASVVNSVWALVKVGIRDKISVQDAAIADVVFAILISLFFFIGLSLRTTLKSVSELLPKDMERRMSRMLDLQTELLTRTSMIAESVMDHPTYDSQTNEVSKSECAEVTDIHVDGEPFAEGSDAGEKRHFVVNGTKYELRSSMFRRGRAAHTLPGFS